jgi:ribonuclease PH
MRSSNRKNNELRPIKISLDYLKHPDASVLYEMGDTKVICAATILDSVPPHKKGTNSGWVTAEYSLLPGSTTQRVTREHFSGRIRGRTQEIQRLIGRSLRAAVDLNVLGEKTILIDADVIQADGGTRTASINGSYIVLYKAVRKLLSEGQIQRNPIKELIGAVSVGIVNGEDLLDLDYAEDSSAEVDMNVVLSQKGEVVEIQATSEGKLFPQEKLSSLFSLANKGISKIIKKSQEVLK